MYKLIMELKQIIDDKASSFEGVNFEGQVSIKGDILLLEITQFKRGRFYFAEISSNSMSNDGKNNLVFSKTLDLYEELVENKLLEINDEGCLVVPMQMLSKKKEISFKIIIPLTNVEFNSEQQEKHKLYDEIARVNKQKSHLKYILSKYYKIHFSKDVINSNCQINFTGDSSNLDYKSFEIIKNGKQIIKMEKDFWKMFNHCLTLPDLGVYYFTFKIVKTADKSIFAGVCGKDIIGEDKAYRSPYFIGLLLNNGNIYFSKTNKVAAGPIELVEGKSIFKVEINMNQKFLKWFMDDKRICEEKINQNLLNKEIYPMVALYDQGDVIQFID